MSQLHRWLPLFKLSTTGQLQYWEIYVRDNTIVTKHGVYQGAIQETTDKIREGKNIGKKNETTPHEQAVKEAGSKWQKKIDKGYTADIEKAKRGESDTLTAWSPMLAHSHSDHAKKIIYPCFVQPKLDGLRAIRAGGFHSRAGKPFPIIRHIENELYDHGLDTKNLDGELYTHAYKDNFEKIVSMVKRGKTEHEDILQLQYHVYDVNIAGPFGIRIGYLSRLPVMKYVKVVPSYLVRDKVEMLDLYTQFMEEGYEGAILRNMHGPYEQKRSYHLQKHKEFIDSEFPIVGIEEGRGKLAGHVGNFVCEYKGNTFGVKLKGSTDYLKECYENHDLWKDKWLSVKFQGFTASNNVPRFPVGLKIRDVE